MSLRARPIVLVTGFEPFGGQSINPSTLVANALAGKTIAGRQVVAKVLPCVFGAAATALIRTVRSLRPELVVCVGEAGGREEITIERVAINVNDARIADNAGAQPIDTPVVARGPVAYWSTLPIKSIVEAIESAGIPASVSSSAGTFVCNHVFYKLMHELRDQPATRGGFVHVPFLPEQATNEYADAPVMPLAMQVRAIEIAVETALTNHRDRLGHRTKNASSP